MRWHETGREDRIRLAETPGVSSAPPYVKACQLPFIWVWIIPFHSDPLLLGFSSCSSLPFDNLLFISASAEKALGLWKKPNFIGSIPLSFSQTHTYMVNVEKS